MLAQLLGFVTDLQAWAVWLAPVVGIVAGGAVYFAGRWVFRRRSAVAAAKSDPPPPRPVQRACSGPSDPFLQGSTVEKRASLRRRGNAIAVLVSNVDATAPPSSGWVIDRSMGGLCLSVDKEMPAGSILSVRTSNAPTSAPWVQVEVRNCRPVGKDWELGCQFVRTPPWSVLLLFG